MNLPSQKVVILILVIITGALFMSTSVQAGASSPSCVSNSCFTTDGVTFADFAQIFHFTLKGIDGFVVSDTSGITSSIRIIVHDLFKVGDFTNFRNTLIKIVDSFKVFDFSLLNGNAIAIITITVTSVVSSLVNSCSAQSCYVNPNGTGIEAIAEQAIFPLLFIMGTAFGFMYMGIKFFGVLVLVATFILLGLAYIGIIPSYFTLLTILAVGAALTKMVQGMIGNTGES